MRIIGHIQHPVLKITVFKTDARLIVKFENAHFEQNYKVRIADQMSTLADAQRLVDEAFLGEIYANFNGMGKALVETMRRNANPASE